ncbi:alanyl-tRNA synthetase [Caldanaerobius fijiensis DSM 17918]|uniref:Alanine--tRNA ligase n=1 Tax=Caldanaerobius fijiensis DSM 17918 TaxID=1121256 RepID=A0A1M4U175_9THEO|nr:alanine--tRNA ligase [Caldanaerobius fijiensis]SHE50469.1 alanyl-tRNA synthetase [Caldanaerobius fijiensis DSM 17918]
MEKLSMNEIRELYLSFFESKGHLRLPSFSLIPKNDKSLLLINSGMAPLKPYFTGKETPPCKRVTTCQKCIRTPDIERVGKTARHGTFFEMLGNFSFGDYFKKEVIPWAWELTTKVYKLPEDRLWITIYEEDEEAFEIWRQVGVPEDRIIRRGKEDNFWEIGTGPCGPCSELYYDRGEKRGKCGKAHCHMFHGIVRGKEVDNEVVDENICEDCDRFLEFWNLVFTQYDKDEAGNYNPLPNPNIDTGMGLERMAVIIQDVESIFEVDIIKAIMDHISDMVGIKYGEDPSKDVSLRVITDHIRGITFMISDGILPSNEGRGYVLRRIIRRAARHGRLLGLNEPFLFKVCQKVIEQYRGTYKELENKSDYIKRVIKREEERFAATIEQGLNILDQYVDELLQHGYSVLSGEKAFKLYDTYGFPLDLTKEILAEKGFSVDEEAFNELMREQKERARAHAIADASLWSLDDTKEQFAKVKTQFVGYEQYEAEAKVLGIILNDSVINSAEEGQEVGIILDITPFYAESGGQVGDTGVIFNDNMEFKVENTVKFGGDKILHNGRVLSGRISVGDDVIGRIDVDRREDAARNHTATHLLHKVLRNLLGDHVHQSGSYVGPDRLRFDFTHFEQISDDVIERIQQEVNKKIYENISVSVEEMPIDQARRSGAMALFDEKYGDIVRVVSIGDFSKEFCGGTHVENTSQIGLFKIISETSVGAGIRRIEALTGRGALAYLNERDGIVEKASRLLKISASKELLGKIDELMEQIKRLEKEKNALNEKIASFYAHTLMENAQDISNLKLVAAKLENIDVDGLKLLGDSIKEKFAECVVILAGIEKNKVNFVGMATKGAVAQGIHVGNVLREVAKIAGGGGGGRPNMAQAGGKDPSKVEEALALAKKLIEGQLNN